MVELVIIAVLAKYLMHRDLSIGNVITFRRVVGERRKGYLIDWEIACDTLHDLLAREYSKTVRHFDDHYS